MIHFIIPAHQACDLVMTLSFEPATAWMARNPSSSIEGLPCMYMPGGNVESARTGFFVSDPVRSSRTKSDTVLVAVDEIIESAPLEKCLIPLVTQQPLRPGIEERTNGT